MKSVMLQFWVENPCLWALTIESEFLSLVWMRDKCFHTPTISVCGVCLYMDVCLKRVLKSVCMSDCSDADTHTDKTLWRSVVVDKLRGTAGSRNRSVKAKLPHTQRSVLINNICEASLQ